MNRQLAAASLLLLLGFVFSPCKAFAPIVSLSHLREIGPITSTQKAAFDPFSSLEVSASTLDPTTVLTDLFSGLLNSPAILAVPIIAALGVASLIAFIIISYASPVVEDDE